MFDLNAYLMDDKNLTDECIETRKRLRTHAGGRLAASFDFRIARPITCADGLSFSVQAGQFHYAEPRQNVGPWLTVEIGFPNRVVQEFMRYADDPNDPTGTVYGYVPVAVVEDVIDRHNGMI